jgi:hypothetical protein
MLTDTLSGAWWRTMPECYAADFRSMSAAYACLLRHRIAGNRSGVRSALSRVRSIRRRLRFGDVPQAFHRMASAAETIAEGARRGR